MAEGGFGDLVDTLQTKFQKIQNLYPKTVTCKRRILTCHIN